ncbi:hypothetical protein CWB99_04215 [Pseudoalteromonas rubra]|uniref:ATP-grasp domain-containing protein n=1 Tax=Pseudoalteromonas rubra TaxID=43658 RepID=A0A5S3WST7_9GAMM|nr:ATP-grasp domain-containing protein [Pseudoalteromonas rubra]TMP31466.1 hypothetical protein CWB99_04215 [Pseudoalteromonas rubra]TMP34550.1 hypothetical protein CWC00_07120 [Pseudoalteromonas rubra]
MSEKIMILGAGVYQVPLIKKAKELNFTTIVVSPNGNYPGLLIADECVFCDIKDEVEVLKHAKKHDISGIVTTGSDVGVPTIGYVTEHLGLSGIGYENAKACTNKVRMKRKLLDANVNTAKFAVIQSKAEMQQALESFTYPVMIKAPNLSGSRGITKVYNLDEALNAFELATEISKSNEIIVEEFLEGEELGAEVIIDRNGNAKVIIHDRINFSGKTDVPIGHAIPSQCSDIVKKNIETELLKAVEALNITCTVSNSDIMVVGEQAFIIEIGGRMGATCIPENIASFYNVDMYELIIDLCLGRNIDMSFSGSGKANVSRLLISDKAGVIKGIEMPDVSSMENVEAFQLDYGVSENVRKFAVGPDRIGHIVVSGSSVAEAGSELDRLLSDINIVIRG